MPYLWNFLLHLGKKCIFQQFSPLMRPRPYKVALPKRSCIIESWQISCRYVNFSYLLIKGKNCWKMHFLRKWSLKFHKQGKDSNTNQYFLPTIALETMFRSQPSFFYMKGTPKYFFGTHNGPIFFFKLVSGWSDSYDFLSKGRPTTLFRVDMWLKVKIVPDSWKWIRLWKFGSYWVQKYLFHQNRWYQKKTRPKFPRHLSYTTTLHQFFFQRGKFLESVKFFGKPAS